VHYRAKSTGILGNNIRAGLQFNDIRYVGGSNNPPQSWTQYSNTWGTNPIGGAWTVDQINGVASATELQQFGVYSNDLAPDVQVSAVWATVAYIIPSNWNVPQTVTATGVNDRIDDGDIYYTVITAPAISVDLTFNGLNMAYLRPDHYRSRWYSGIYCRIEYATYR
jgi:hypothetical protein